MMAGAGMKVSNQGLVIQTSQGVYDLTGQMAAATPTPAVNLNARPMMGRKTPLRTPLRLDLSYQLAGVLDASSGGGKAVRKAARERETITLLETQSDNLHWWLSQLLIPDADDGNDDLIIFNWSMQSDGSPWAHGRQIDGASVAAQAKSNVPAGALAMLAVVDKGDLTSVTLRYTANSTDYDFVATPTADGIFMGPLKSSANAAIPSGADSGSFKIITAPDPASGHKLIAGFGLYAFEVL